MIRGMDPVPLQPPFDELRSLLLQLRQVMATDQNLSSHPQTRGESPGGGQPTTDSSDDTTGPGAVSDRTTSRGHATTAVTSANDAARSHTVDLLFSKLDAWVNVAEQRRSRSESIIASARDVFIAIDVQ
jgi:hypothetical protein